VLHVKLSIPRKIYEIKAYISGEKNMEREREKWASS
jgi:hypothetical protein